MNIVGISKNIVFRLKNHIRKTRLYLVEEYKYLVLGMPSKEIDCIKNYFRTHNAQRYLSSYSNESIKRIVIQMGMDKTASTSIQTFLHQNQELLHQNSIEFRTDWGGNNHSVPLKSIVAENPEKIYHHMVSNHNSEQIHKYNGNNLLALCRGIEACQQETYVFFGEGICSFKKAEYETLKNMLAILMPNAEIKILHCVRSNIGYASSAYQQAVKVGRYHDSDDQIKRYSNLYKNRITNAIKIFGKDKIDVYKFEETVQNKLGPIGFFLEKLGIPTEELSLLDFPRQNESISYNALEILEYINKKYPMVIEGGMNHLRYRHDTDPIMEITGPRYKISNDMALRIIIEAQKDILWLEESFSIKYSLTHQQIKGVDLKYDDTYYDECIRVYDYLDGFAKQIFYDFFVDKHTDVTNKEHRDTFEKIITYISENDNFIKDDYT